MKKKSTASPFGSRDMLASLEEMARQRIQGFVQELLEEEVTALVGRGRCERRPVVSEGPVVYRSGHGNTRQLRRWRKKALHPQCRARSADPRWQLRSPQSDTTADGRAEVEA